MLDNEKEYKIAFAEVYDILKFTDKSVIDKISKSFIKFIDDNRDKNYITNLNPYLPLEEQEMSETARNIIDLIYMSYLATPEEKLEFRKNISTAK